MKRTFWTSLCVFPIHCYRLLISPLLPKTCRHYPTCSNYAVEAIKTHGVLKGIRLALKRISSCHPGNDQWFDPVPSKDCYEKIENETNDKPVCGCSKI